MGEDGKWFGESAFHQVVEYIFTLFKYEPAHQVKTDHARFVHLPALSEHEKNHIPKRAYGFC